MVLYFLSALSVFFCSFNHSFISYPSVFCAPETGLDSPLVRNIIESVPMELKGETLMIPRFDLLDPEKAVMGEERKFMIAVNRQAKQGNTTMNKVVLKNYDHTYGLVTLQSIDSLQEKGYRYFVDMVLMPKQMKYPKKEAMIPMYRKHKSLNSAFTNRYSQFVYYFYIRDLRTNDAYISSKFKGHPEAYKGIGNFLKRVNADLAEE